MFKSIVDYLRFLLSTQENSTPVKTGQMSRAQFAAVVRDLVGGIGFDDDDIVNQATGLEIDTLVSNHFQMPHQRFVHLPTYGDFVDSLYTRYLNMK